VQMPDEYDRIHDDLAPYWGLSPAAFRGLEHAHEAHQETYTLGRVGAHGVMVVNMSLPNQGMKGHLQGAYEIADTLAPVQEHLPPFRAVFSPHDNPTVGLSAEWRALALKAVREGRCACTDPSFGQSADAYMHLDLDLDHMPPIESVGWLSGCAKDSPARTQPYDLEHPPAPPTKKTFIHDHLAAMSPCAHPSLLHHHGQFLAHEYGPGPWSPPAPQFSYSVTSLHADIRPATPFNWVEDVPGDVPWDAKTDNRLLWRGSNTGIWQGAGMRYWRGTHRNRMVALADRTRGAADVLVADAADEPVQTKTLPLRRLNRALLDLEFSGSPLNCDDTTCPELQRMFEWDESMDYRTAGDYKYVMDVRARRPRAPVRPRSRAQVDGNGWSSRFKRLITSHALIFKATAYPEWFTERLQPWVHYVPVQLDYSDLYDALVFFRGDAAGAGAHEHLAKKIALAGREWSQTFWRREDITAYNFRCVAACVSARGRELTGRRLMLEYGRLMSFDRDAATYSEADEGW
jgi:hypothetical protein